jgi:hypothetical protein
MGRKGIDALTDWVRVKFGIGEEKEARGAAFAVAAGIARWGTQGAFMFHQAIEDNEAGVQQCFDRALERIGVRLAAMGTA